MLLRGEKHGYVFTPLDSITASELAEAMDMMVAGIAAAIQAIPPAAVDLCYESLSDATRSHFEIKEYQAILVPGG